MKIDRSRINVSTYAYWHYTLDYCLDSIAACGFQNVEFWAASPQYSYLDYTPSERMARKREINAMLASRGLKMPVFHPEQSSMYPLNIASPNEYLQSHSMQYMREYIDDAADFGAKIMVLAPGWHVHDDTDPANYQRSVDSISALCQYASQYDLTLVTEEWPDIRRAFVDNLPALRKLVDDVHMPNFKACLNSDLMHGNQETVQDYLQVMGGDLRLVHLADEGSRAMGTGAAGAADLKALEASDYAGPITLDLRFRDVCVEPDKPVFASAAWLRANGYLD